MVKFGRTSCCDSVTDIGPCFSTLSGQYCSHFTCRVTKVLYRFLKNTHIGWLVGLLLSVILIQTFVDKWGVHHSLVQIVLGQLQMMCRNKKIRRRMVTCCIFCLFMLLCSLLLKIHLSTKASLWEANVLRLSLTVYVTRLTNKMNCYYLF